MPGRKPYIKWKNVTLGRDSDLEKRKKGTDLHRKGKLPGVTCKFKARADKK